MADRPSFDVLEHFERLQPILRARPLGIFCDVDGTLSPIAPTPEAASVPEATQGALASVAERVDLVAAISGRPAIEVLDRLAVPGLVVVGNHGFERWTGERLVRPDEVAPYVERLAALLRDAERGLDVPGLRIENKGPTASLHFRASPDPDAARERILQWAGAARLEPDFHITEGRRVLEIRPALPHNKGTAVLDLIRAYRLSGAIYVGDDWTDVHAFQALRTWREAEGSLALSIAVASAETSPEIVAAADAFVVDQPAVETLLTRLARSLAGESTIRD